jgi:hypothetical protein
MRNSENFKTVWWGILVVVIGYYLFDRYPELVASKPSYFDAIVFIVWIGVCLAPIYQEMNILGFKFKQQFDDLKKDINHQLSMMKVELQSSIEVSNANQNHISVNTSSEPPRDSEIPQLEASIDQILKSRGSERTDYQLPDVSPDSVEMFKVRLAFERLVNKYTSENISMLATDISRRKGYSLGRILNELRKYSSISDGVINGVIEIINICNYGIHNEKISEQQLNFVRKSSSSLYIALEQELRENGL